MAPGMMRTLLFVVLSCSAFGSSPDRDDAARRAARRALLGAAQCGRPTTPEPAPATTAGSCTF
jgi:hypothetical protein